MSKPLFNSLGSNYTQAAVWLAVRQLLWPDASAPARLQALIQERWPGEVQLVYKGRDAIELALRALKIGRGQAVITQAFSCHAIEEGITRTGAVPLYADIDPVRLNPSVKTLEIVRRQHPNAQAVIIQHTLGLPAEIQKIRAWCDRHDLWLIEDLAQAAGATDEHGVPVGTLADVVVLSFGRDKVIDGVSGGAVILRDPSLRWPKMVLPNVPWMVVVQDITYPLMTGLIRVTFASGLGKIIWKIGRWTGWLRSPVASPTDQAALLPTGLAALAAAQLATLSSTLAHRRQVAEAYQRALGQTPMALPVYKIPGMMAGASHQRYLIQIADPTVLIQRLAKHKVFISDRWYRQAVDSGSLNRPSVYQSGSCPEAEKLAHHCVNLPTNQTISTVVATQIARQVYA